MSVTLCEMMDQLRSKKGNSSVIFVPYILLISCLPNVSKQFYHGTGGYQLSAQHRIGLVIVAWENIVSDHTADKGQTVNRLEFLCSSLFY